MIRNIKALGLAIVAVAAMSMAAASAAQASELHATHPGDVVLTGQQIAKHKFQITHAVGGPSTECAKATFEGTLAWNGAGQQNTAQEGTLTAAYTECTSFAGIPAQVLMNGCKYTITGSNPTVQPPATTAKTAYVDITGCTTGKQIEIIVPNICTITVPEQTHLQHIVFTNKPEPETKPHDVEANVTITGITYQVHRNSAFCPEQSAIATQTRSDAQYQGQATFRAYKKTGQHQVTEHGHQFTKQTHNNEQVGLLAT